MQGIEYGEVLSRESCLCVDTLPSSFPTWLSHFVLLPAWLGGLRFLANVHTASEFSLSLGYKLVFFMDSLMLPVRIH